MGRGAVDAAVSFKGGLLAQLKNVKERFIDVLRGFTADGFNCWKTESSNLN